MSDIRKFIFEQIKRDLIDVGDTLNINGILYSSSVSTLPPHSREQIDSYLDVLIKEGICSLDSNGIIRLTEKGYNEVWEMGDNPETRAQEDVKQFIYHTLKSSRIGKNEAFRQTILTSNLGYQPPHVYNHFDEVFDTMFSSGLLEEKENFYILTEKGYNEIWGL